MDGQLSRGNFALVHVDALSDISVVRKEDGYTPCREDNDK